MIASSASSCKRAIENKARSQLMNITFVEVENLVAALIAAVGDGLRSIGVHATDAVDPRAAFDVDSAQIGGDTTILKLIAVAAANHVDDSTRRWNEIEVLSCWACLFFRTEPGYLIIDS
jgi:hypothetical protein